MNSHPNVATDLQNLRAPLNAQRNQCGLQLPASNVLMGLGSLFTGGMLPGIFGGGFG